MCAQLQQLHGMQKILFLFFACFAVWLSLHYYDERVKFKGIKSFDTLHDKPNKQKKTLSLYECRNVVKCIKT